MDIQLLSMLLLLLPQIKNKASFKTVDNTLGAMTLKRLIVRPRRGKYSLSPKQLQEFESKESLPMAGSDRPRGTVITSVTLLPDVLTEGTIGTSQSLLGKSSGKSINSSYINQSKTITSQGREIS